MATLLRQLWSIRVLIIMILTPLLLLPLPLHIATQIQVKDSALVESEYLNKMEPDQANMGEKGGYLNSKTLSWILVIAICGLRTGAMYMEAKAAFVLILMAVFWITEAVPIPVTSLIPAFIFPMLGVVKAQDIVPAYMPDTLMIFIGGLLMAVAMEVWNIHRLVALRILLVVGSKPRWLMVGLMLPTWFLSMFISNTATTAMMIPIAQAIIIKLKETREQMMQIETEKDTSVVEDTENTSQDKKDVEKGENREMSNVNKAISLCICYAANCGGIGALTGTGPNLVVKKYADDLYLKYGETPPINYATWMAFGLPIAFLVLIVTWIWLQVYFLRCSDISGDCKKKTVKDEKGVDKVHQVIKEQYDALGPVTYAQKSVIVLFSLLVISWISRDLGGAGGWGNFFPKGYVRDSTPAVLVAVIMFFLPSEAPHIFCLNKKDEVNVKTPRPLLIWEEAHEKLPWGIFILLGGGFALAKGCEVSGLSLWIGEQLAVLSGLNKWLMLFILCYICVFLTEFISNVALATLIIPILGSLAIDTGVNPLFYILPAAVSCSFAYMLPVATQPNALCFSYGHLKVVDMAMAGFFLNIICVPVLIFVTFTSGDALFNFSLIPSGFLNNSTILNETLSHSI